MKLHPGINRELGRYMGSKLPANNMLGKYGVFWFQLAAEMERFQMHLVTTTYGGNAMGS